MAVQKFKTCLPEKEFKALMRLAKKYYQGNRAAALADAVKLLNKAYLRGKVVDGRRFAAISECRLASGKEEGDIDADN